MFEDTYPVTWTGQQAAVSLPEHVDVSNSGQIREELPSVINRGANALMVDMTPTDSCDHAGAEVMVRAYQRALVSGTQIRLVAIAPIVRRVLSVNGLDRFIPPSKPPPPQACRELDPDSRCGRWPEPGAGVGCLTSWSAPSRPGPGRALASSAVTLVPSCVAPCPLYSNFAIITTEHAAPDPGSGQNRDG